MRFIGVLVATATMGMVVFACVVVVALSTDTGIDRHTAFYGSMMGSFVVAVIADQILDIRCKLKDATKD